MSRSLLTMTVLLLLATVASAQPNPDYFLRTTDASGAPGETVTSAVLLDILGADSSAGWSYGVCSDPSHVALLDVVDGAATAALGGGAGPDFNQVNIFADGYTVGVVISFLGLETLDPGVDYELNIGSYELIGALGTSSEVSMCSTLGSPVVAVVVVVNGQSVEPTTAAGALLIDGPPQTFEFTTDSPTVPYSSVDGVASFSAQCYIRDNVAPARDTQGFSIGLAHDGALLTATSLVAVGDLLALDPDFFGETLLADGVTLGVVYDFLGGAFLQFPTASAVVSVDYSTVASSFIGVDGITTTNLDFIDTLGSPPVANVVVVAGASIDVDGVSGTVTLEGSTGPTLALFAVGDGNGDGLFNLADPIYLLNFLFQSGPASTCPASLDADADGGLTQMDAVLMLEFLYIGGPPPAAPYPDCGTRDGVFTDDCTFAGCP